MTRSREPSAISVVCAAPTPAGRKRAALFRGRRAPVPFPDVAGCRRRSVDFSPHYDVEDARPSIRRVGFMPATSIDSIVETRVLEYHGEKRGDLIYTKPMLLGIGDMYEEQIAKDRAEDAAYR